MFSKFSFFFSSAVWFISCSDKAQQATRLLWKKKKALFIFCIIVFFRWTSSENVEDMCTNIVTGEDGNRLCEQEWNIRITPNRKPSTALFFPFPK